MIHGCTPPFEDSQPPASVRSRRRQQGRERGLFHVERAGTCHQHPSRLQHLQGAQVDLLVAAQGSFDRRLALGKSRRVEDDGVVLAAGRRVVLKQVKGIGFDPVDLAAGVGVTIEFLVLFRDF